ncbi:ATP-binding cassette, subfamily B, heavy metal transporter [Pancytospora epiphaga]|nr:ATP-binding cassette, subfamily B, heavy metal transporter [Pancytospora epiphaga]
MAKYANISTTFLGYAVSCVVSSKQTLYFLITAFAVMIANAIVSIKLKKVSAAIFNATVLIDNKQDQIIDLFFQLVLTIAIHYSLSSLLDYTKDCISYRVYRKSIADSTRETVSMSPLDFHSKGTGKAQENITRSSYSMWEAAIIIFIDIPQCFIFFCFYTHALLKLFQGTVAFLYFLGIFVCVVTAFAITRISKKYESHFYRLYLQTHVLLTDILLNFDIVKAFNREERELEAYDKSFSPLDSKIKRYHWIQNIFACIQKFLLMTPHFIILYLFFIGYNTGLTANNLIFYNSVFMSYKGNFVTLRNYVFALTKKSADMEPRLTHKLKDETGSIVISDFRTSIVAENADLYAGDSLVNSNLSFEIKKGEKVAITGYNGSGKSTFIKTLCRLHDGRGGIKIDGIDIDMLTDSSVRNLIGYVSQDHHIFNNTVIYNLSYGQSKYNEQEIYRLCQDYGLHEFFKNLPDGYFTMAGENGKYLSGGQKQRINFMRAVIKGAPILVLDEPTANLDKKTEMDIIDSVLTCDDDRTLIVILHNLDLLEKFKKILYFTNNGVQVYNSYLDFQKK